MTRRTCWSSVARPVAMFVDQSDAAMIDAAIDAGVSAYIVDGLRKERVKPILEMTISRFNAFAKLNRELETAKSQLDDRKAIDRAKALVMRAGPSRRNRPMPLCAMSR